MALSYKSLWDKYMAFSSPNASIKISGLDLMEKDDCTVKSLEISLTTTNKAGMAVVELETDEANTNLTELLTVGEFIEITLGYGDALKPMFMGYLHQIRSYCSTEIRQFSLVGLDCKGLMAQGTFLRMDGQKKLPALIQDVMGKSRYTKFYSGKQVGAVPKPFDEEIAQNACCDMQFLQEWARRFGYYFFFRHDTLIFDASVKKADTLELDYNNGLIWAAGISDLSGQVKQVQVLGIDPDGNRILSSAASKTTPPVLHAVGEMDVRGELSYGKKEQLDYLANAFRDDLDSNFYTFEAECIGLPELLPLNNIRAASETWEIREAVHTFNENGYHTKIRGGVL
ncbi:MAG: hypothetical protein LBR74_01575 [Eubacterium sp.]|nr:hypothetical protein [Eubacterium sp.]